MNKIIVILPLLWAFQMMAQPLEMNSRKPDFKEIQKVITDKKSPFFYDNLFKRYMSGDTTLTTTDYWYLYYGYSFQSKYMPYQTIEGMEDFNKITQKQQLDEKDFRKIISIAEKEMKKLPFELDLLWYEYVAWKGLNDTAKASICRHQFMGLVDAIIASGDGMACESAFHVLYVAHEYVMLNVMGFQFAGKQSLTDDRCDMLQLVGNEYEIDRLYFDVNRIFEVNMKLINGK